MKISSEQIENSQVSLNVEMDAVELDEYLKKAYNHLVGRVRVPGFRKGKAPRVVLERHIGKENLLQEALDHLIPEAYEKALEDQKLEPIARPEIHLIQTEPVIFKAIVPIRPEVKLGDYGGIRLEPAKVEVDEEEVEAAIEQLRNQQAVLLPVDRPAEIGDTLTMDIEGENQGGPFPIRKDLVFELVKESPLPLPGFTEKLEGAYPGEEKNFVLSYPADYKIEELSGKEYLFKVKVHEVKRKELPEPNDEFAVLLGSDNMSSLTLSIPSQLRQKMKKFKYINWSEVARTAIINKMKLLEKMDKLLEESSLTEKDTVKYGRMIKKRQWSQTKKMLDQS